jgi:hypothetical protein
MSGKALPHNDLTSTLEIPVAITLEIPYQVRMATKLEIRFDLRELRRSHALRQGELGSFWTVLQVEKGRRLPGPTVLAQWAAKLGLPAPTVMAACRESQRRALVARGRSQRLVVGKAHRLGSCAHVSRRAVRKAGQS